MPEPLASFLKSISNNFHNTPAFEESPDASNRDTVIKSSKTGASVSCTATIDTKIEHALDVVKNHLTHAVRLEVEELKIKINELVERISYLEYENDVLRSNVTADVLANLER